jgi:hypothetical protein
VIDEQQPDESKGGTMTDEQATTIEETPVPETATEAPAASNQGDGAGEQASDEAAPV